mmetsp:Transcript_107958/g.337686  ORF Transcript_107958/g.337686 Transcript_107958/m.337686 type:complete len:549 (-) Transcript_107958:259-1905(-)
MDERPEPPERTPDIPDDLEHALLSRKGQRIESRAPGKSKTYTGACICGIIILALGLAMVFFTSPQLRRTGVGNYLQVGPAQHSQDQAPEAAGGSVLAPQPVEGAPRAADAGDAGGVATASAAAAGRAAAATQQAAPQGAVSVKQTSDDMVLVAPPPDIEICNTSAAYPEPALRSWDVPAGWRRVCEEKNSKDKYPFERNWCWVGLNSMCHWNLKNHHPWAELQDMAADQGLTVPAKDSSFSPLQNPELCDRPENGRMRNWTQDEWEASRRWFKAHVSVYVLSLPKLGARRWKTIRKRLAELDIFATLVPGVDMREPGALYEAKRQGFMLEAFNFSRAQEIAYSWKHDMGSILGTAGCASAHFKAQAKVMTDGSPLAVVMEDDSWPSDDFVPRLWSLVREELPCDWEVTALLSRCGYGRCISPHLMRVMPDANEPAWRCRQGSNWGMHAVLYRTEALPRLQELWKRTVFNEDQPHCMDVDVALASISDQANFYAVPSVQDPGFVKEANHRSARWDINQAAVSTSTSTTTGYVVPTLKPGEPWPGAWSFG